jgi:hypothetical protein
MSQDNKKKCVFCIFSIILVGILILAIILSTEAEIDKENKIRNSIVSNLIMANNQNNTISVYSEQCDGFNNKGTIFFIKNMSLSNFNIFENPLNLKIIEKFSDLLIKLGKSLAYKKTAKRRIDNKVLLFGCNKNNKTSDIEICLRFTSRVTNIINQINEFLSFFPNNIIYFEESNFTNNIPINYKEYIQISNINIASSDGKVFYCHKILC